MPIKLYRVLKEQWPDRIIFLREPYDESELRVTFHSFWGMTIYNHTLYHDLPLDRN